MTKWYLLGDETACYTHVALSNDHSRSITIDLPIVLFTPRLIVVGALLKVLRSETAIQTRIRLNKISIHIGPLLQ